MAITGKGQLFQSDEYAKLRAEAFEHMRDEREVVDGVLDTDEVWQRLGDLLQRRKLDGDGSPSRDVIEH